MVFTDQPESPCRDKLSMAFTQKTPNRRVYDFCRCQMQFDESWSTLTPHSHTKTLIPPPHCLLQQLSGSPCCRGQGWVLGLNQSCHGCQACLCLLLITCRPPQVLSASLVLSLSRGSRRADNHVAEPAQKHVFCNPSKKKKMHVCARYLDSSRASQYKGRAVHEAAEKEKPAELGNRWMNDQ